MRKNLVQMLDELGLNPSGGNGHRHKQFAENKEQMQKMLQNYFSKGITV